MFSRKLLLGLVLLATLSAVVVTVAAGRAIGAKDCGREAQELRGSQGDRRTIHEAIMAEIDRRGRETPNEVGTASLSFDHHLSIATASQFADQNNLKTKGLHAQFPWQQTTLQTHINVGPDGIDAALLQWRQRMLNLLDRAPADPGGSDKRYERASFGVIGPFQPWTWNRSGLTYGPLLQMILCPVHH